MKARNFSQTGTSVQSAVSKILGKRWASRTWRPSVSHRTQMLGLEKRYLPERKLLRCAFLRSQCRSDTTGLLHICRSFGSGQEAKTLAWVAPSASTKRLCLRVSVSQRFLSTCEFDRLEEVRACWFCRWFPSHYHSSEQWILLRPRYTCSRLEPFGEYSAPQSSFRWLACTARLCFANSEQSCLESVEDARWLAAGSFHSISLKVGPDPQK